MSILHEISGCEKTERKADVVFVHGLGGDAFKTWRYGQDDSTSWPHWLGLEFPDVGVWSVGYAASSTKWARLRALFSKNSRDTGYGMALRDRAAQMLDLMVQRGLGERPLFFICHSLGGLVMKRILRASHDDTSGMLNRVFENTRAVLFLATPHSGASLASLAKAFRKVFRATITIQELREHDAHLIDLADWYRDHAIAARIQTATYFEERPVRGFKVVSRDSAHPGVGAIPVALDEDHISIAKPRERNAQVCGAACEMLRKFVLTPRPTLPASITNSPEVVTLDEGFRIAVLPFKSSGANADLASFANELTDYIATGMSHFSFLQVIAPSSTLEYADLAIDRRAAGKELSARYVVEGRLRQEGAKLRIEVSLVDTQTGANLWADSFPQALKLEARFKLLDKVVPRIVSTVADARGVLAQTVGESLRGLSAEELSPYQAVLRSFAYFHRLSVEEHALARTALELAVARAPGLSVARAWLAIMYREEHVHRFPGQPDPLGRASKAAYEAIELNSFDHWAHLALASVLYYQRNIPAFRSEAKKAIDSNPMDGSSMAYLASLLAVSGAWEEGCALMRKAQRLNRRFPGWYWIPAIGNAYRQGHYQRSLKLALEIKMPAFWIGQFLLTAIYGQLGELEKAQQAAQMLLRLWPEFINEARKEFEKRYEQEFLNHLIEGLRKAGMEIADGALGSGIERPL